MLELLAGINGTGDSKSTLLALPAQGISVLHLYQFDARRNKPVLILKRPFVKEGTPVEGAYIVLVLDFSQIQRKLFEKIQVGKNGFISILAKTNSGKIALPPRMGLDSEERKHFSEISRQWLSFDDVPRQYRSIVFGQQQIAARPFSIVGVASRNDISEPVLKLVYFSAALGVLALGIWSAIFLSGKLTAPILRLTARAEQLAQDHLSLSAPETHTTDSFAQHIRPNFVEMASADELGSLAHSFARMQEAIREKIDLIETQNEQLRKSDLLKEELNQSLEQKVQRRTHQLQEALETQRNFSEKLVDKSQALEMTLHDLKTTQQQLLEQEKMAGLGTLTAGIAHEINNPINFTHVAAQNFRIDLAEFQKFVAELVEADEAPEILLAFAARFSKLSAHVATMLNGTERIKTIVKDLRTFSRLDQTEKNTVRLSDCLISTLNLVRTGWQEKVEFDTEFIDDPQIECWPALLNQVFMNLLVNGCQAIAERQLQNTSLVPGHVQVRMRCKDDAAVISFTDNGIGIPPEVQAHIMEPFYTTKEVGVGTGLGLSIVYGIVEKHGGNLSFTSTPGQGSCFSVSLPLHPT